MKILAITYMYPSPYLEFSGIFIHRQLKALQKRGHDIKVLKLHPYVPSVLKVFNRYKQLAAISSHYQWEGIPVEVVKIPPLKSRYALRANPVLMGLSTLWWSITKRIKNDFDVLYGHEIHKGAPAAVLLGKAIGKPAVVFGYGRDINVYSQTDFFVRQIAKWTLKNASKVMVVSNELKRNAQKICEARSDIVVNPTGVDFERFNVKKSKKELRKQFGLPDDKFIFLFVGRLEREKGVYELLSATAKLASEKEFFVALVGPITDKQIETEIERIGINNRTILLGLRKPDEIPQIMAAADCLVLPSHTEGLPNVVLEAMAAHLPVVASSVGGIPDVVIDGKTGWLIKPQSVDSLVRAMREVLSKPKERQRRAENAYKLITTRYTWEHHAQVAEQVLLSAVNSGL